MLAGERTSISPTPSASGSAIRTSTTGSAMPDDQGRSANDGPEHRVTAPPVSLRPYIVETLRLTFGNASRTRSTRAGGTAIPPMVAARIEEKS